MIDVLCKIRDADILSKPQFAERIEYEPELSVDEKKSAKPGNGLLYH
jgi:hypothetical protein